MSAAASAQVGAFLPVLGRELQAPRQWGWLLTLGHGLRATDSWREPPCASVTCTAASIPLRH